MLAVWRAYHCCAMCDLCSQVKFKESHASFLQFITSVCAIVGGVFTVSGIIDATWYHGSRAVRRKMELGKLS